MSRSPQKKALALTGVFLAAWLGVKYLLPMVMPFLLGGGIALAAEPAVRFAQRRLKLKRGAAAGIGVSVTLLFLAAVAVLLGALAVRELGQLARALPELEGTARQGLTALQDWLLSLAGRLPDGIGSALTDSLLRLFGSGTDLADSLVGRLPRLATDLLSILPDSFLSLGTGLLSGFLISARLPWIRQAVAARLPHVWREKYLPTIKDMRKALGGWLRAQCRLAGVTYCIVTLGFLILRIPYGPLWAIAVALVDAVPMLGTGTVLIPWSIVSFLQGDTVPGIGLLAVYVVSALTRSAMEPRLVGRQLGIDPLVTLVALYAGYQLWGFPGLLLAPMLATAVMQLIRRGQESGK